MTCAPIRSLCVSRKGGRGPLKKGERIGAHVIRLTYVPD